MSLQAQESAAKRATHQSMFEAKSFSVHREPASSRWDICEIGVGPFLGPCVQLTLNVAASSEFQLASNESRTCLREGKELFPK